MQVTIPDDLARGLGAEEKKVLTEIAVALYKTRRLSLAKAARMLRVHRNTFQRILAERGEVLNYTREELDEDVRSAQDLVARTSRS